MEDINYKELEESLRDLVNLVKNIAITIKPLNNDVSFIRAKQVLRKIDDLKEKNNLF